MLSAESIATQERALNNAAFSPPVRVIAVTGGKGGVGKTNVTANLAVSLAQQGSKVLVLDADLGLANIDVMLGLQPKYNISHVISGERNIDEVLIKGPNENVQVIPASSGLHKMTELSHIEHAGVIRAFSELSFNPDVLLIDTAAGISESVITFCRASHDIIVVVCDEPASITDAYALIKLLNREHSYYRFRILANMINSSQDGVNLYKKLVNVTDRFLDVALDYTGAIPYDECLKKAVQKQRAVVDYYPRSKAAVAFGKVTQKIKQWPKPELLSGHIEFFVERLFKTNENESAIIHE